MNRRYPERSIVGDCCFVMQALEGWLHFLVTEKYYIGNSNTKNDLLIASIEITNLINRNEIFLHAHSLPAVQKIVFIRRYLYLDSTEEISKRYGMNLYYTKLLIHRNRIELNRWIEGSHV